MTDRPDISGATMVCAVVGDPVRHSLSPRIHNAWMRTAGLDAVYVALHLRPERAQEDLAGLFRAGILGLNVTVPYKLVALKAAYEASASARRIGAANTLVRSGAGWAAHNTDVDGFEFALEQLAPTDIASGPVLVLGAGGAARAVVDVLSRRGVPLLLVNRTRSAAEALRADLCPEAAVHDASETSRLAAEASLVVDSTSSGHAGEATFDLPPGRGRTFLHLSYGAAAAPMLSTAAREGWTPQDGLPMLVGQAAASFRLWFGGTPDMMSALADCRATQRGAT
jgi:shikimate dehydrogenase